MARSTGHEPDTIVRSTRAVGETVILELAGEVDLHTVEALRAGISEGIDAGARALVVDLSGVTLIDSSGLGALVGGFRRLHERGGDLVVVCCDPSIRKVFEITLLDGVFVIVGSLREAEEHVAL